MLENRAPLRVIFINTFPLYGKDLPVYHPGTEAFYLFGMGSFIAKEFSKRRSPILFENWRVDRRINTPLKKMVKGITCRIFPSNQLRLLPDYSESLLEEIRRESSTGNTVFHFMGAHNLYFHQCAFLMKTNRVVCTHLGGANPLWKYRRNGKLISYFYYLMEKQFFLKNYDHFISPAKQEVSYFQTIGKPVSHMPAFGIANEYLFRIKNRKACRRRLGLASDKKIILQVGRAEESRGFDWILEMVDCGQLGEDFHLLFVGVHQDDPYFIALKERGLDVVGYTSHEDLADYYNAADILIYLPHGEMDLDFAGTSYVPLEAMACGTPVVATTFHHFPGDEYGSVSRTPRNREEAADMIQELAHAKVSRGKCRKIVMRQFSWDTVIRRHLEIYANQAD